MSKNKSMDTALDNAVASFFTPAPTLPQPEPRKAKPAQQITEQPAEGQQVKMVPKVAKDGRGKYPRTKKQDNRPSTQKGLKAGYTRAALIARVETLEKIREIAYIERQPLMEVVDAALTKAVEQYEQEHGTITIHKH